jgi:hypothetical protein
MLGLKIPGLTAHDHFAILLPSFISFFLLEMCGWWVFIYQMQLEKLKKSYQEEQIVLSPLLLQL